MSRTPADGRRSTGRKPGPARRTGRSPQAAVRRRARRVRWTVAGAAAAALAAVIAVVAVVAGGHGAGNAGGTTGSAAAGLPAAGSRAPTGSFTTVSGKSETIASLRGHKTLLWFVTTWCSSCQAGTQALAPKIARFSRMHVRVVEIENYANFGQPGPAITAFGRQLAGPAYHDPAWTFGTASQALTRAYNPQGYLDIYYLLGPSGRIAYIGSSPAATMSQLLAHAGKLP